VGLRCLLLMGRSPVRTWTRCARPALAPTNAASDQPVNAVSGRRAAFHQPPRPVSPIHSGLRALDHAHPGVMTKPTNKRKRSEPEDAGERVVVSEVMLRHAALAYAAVANLDPSDPRWRRCWRALYLAAIGTVGAIQEAADTSTRDGGCPFRGPRRSETSLTPRRLRRQAAL